MDQLNERLVPALLIVMSLSSCLVAQIPVNANDLVEQDTAESFTKTGPKSTQARQLIEKAKGSLAASKNTLALELLNKAISIEPTNAWGYIYRAEALANADSADSSVISNYEKAISCNPILVEPYCGLSIFYSLCDKPELSFKTLKRVPTSETNSPQMHLALAEIYAGGQNWKSAIDEYSILLKSDPKNCTLLRKRGACYSMTKDFSRAVADYSNVLEKRPYDIDVLKLKASANEQAGLWRSAALDYEALIAKTPKNDEGYKQHARAMLRLNATKEALKDYDKVLKLFPQDTDSMVSRGEIYLGEGDLSRAIADFSRAIMLEPKLSKKAYLLRAKCYKLRGDMLKADADLAKAKKLSGL